MPHEPPCIILQWAHKMRLKKIFLILMFSLKYNRNLTYQVHKNTLFQTVLNFVSIEPVNLLSVNSTTSGNKECTCLTFQSWTMYFHS